MLSVFALLTVLLSIINGVNFTMAGNDADMLTQMISDRHGAFSDREDRGQKKKNADHATSDNAQPAFEGKFGEPHGIGPMGPSSPDMNSSLRYFTYAFDKKGNSEKISFKLSAVTEEEAEAWAKTLSSSAVDSTGWTRGTYRYRVYKEGKRTYITVIDQGRELLPSYRILIISIFGEILGLLISFFVPPLYTAVAFDSGGVASGPMTSTFILPFAVGACTALGGNVMTDAFGIVAMVAMTPLITIQGIGLYSSLQQRHRRKQKAQAMSLVPDIMVYYEKAR